MFAVIRWGATDTGGDKHMAAEASGTKYGALEFLVDGQSQGKIPLPVRALPILHSVGLVAYSLTYVLTDS